MTYNREVSDIDAEFARLISERVVKYQVSAAWTAQKGREYLGAYLALGLTYHAVRARAYQIEAEHHAARAQYWLGILITRSY